MPRRRHLTRLTLALLAGLLIALVPGAPARAHNPRPADAGDLWPDFVAWTDEQGLPVQVVTPGQKVRAKFTVRNPQTYPMKVTGVDTQVTADQCAKDVRRLSSKTNPFNMLPVYLMPEQRSGELYDEWFQLSPDSACSQVSLNWVANGIAEQTSSVFPSAKQTAPMPTVTPVAPIPTVTPVETPGGTPAPASTAPTQASTPPTPIDPNEPGPGPDPMPWIIGGGIAALTILLGLVLLLRRRD